MIRVLLVDDQHLMRAGLVKVLAADSEINVVAECSDGDEVLAAVDRHRPDVVLMDVRMKRVDGATATRQLNERPDAPPVLVLTMFDDHDVVAAALAAGAAGFVLKDAPGEEIIQATRAVVGGEGWLDPAVVGRVLDAYRAVAVPHAAETVALRELTGREVEVLELIGGGATNAEIGERLHIGEGTVKSHVGHIFTKLGLRDRTAAVVFAFRHGLVQ